jgi:hypothetical protein
MRSKSNLTSILREKLNTELNIGSLTVKPNELLAGYIIQLMIYARVQLPNGAWIVLSSWDWLEFLQWIYTRVDGAPATVIDDSLMNDDIVQKHIYLPENQRTNSIEMNRE